MKCFKFLFPILTLLLVSACGYNIGARGMMHPQIQTIAIGEIKNNTLEPLGSMVMKQQVAERFQFDGSLKLKNMGEADCVFYGKITDVKNLTIREDSRDFDVTYRPAEFRITVTLEFSVIIPGRGEPLVPTRTVTGYADYQVLSDNAISRANAFRQACYNASKLAVEYTTESW